MPISSVESIAAFSILDHESGDRDLIIMILLCLSMPISTFVPSLLCMRHDRHLPSVKCLRRSCTVPITTGDECFFMVLLFYDLPESFNQTVCTLPLGG